jgi:hypothetical protein
MANEKTPVVWDDTTKKHRPLGTGEKMGGLDASSIISSDSGNLIQTGSDGLAYVSGSSLADPRADNLLETSTNGKLQVTIDRIAEWLDGHPSDAAVLADAMNVVSGDSGNVIVQGTDKGAYLSKAAISAAVAGMTDAQKNAIADAIAARIAGDIADGKTIVASGGKLTADPTNATVAQKKAINQALADADSGLVVDNSTGKLKVDFSQMPTDKFEELLKGLKMQVPLDSNITHIVATADPNAGDTQVDGRGTEAKPWKTIQACITYVTNLYSLNTHTITIRVKSGTYTESLVLPQFDHTSGFIRIESYSGSRDVVVNAPIGSDGFTAGCVAANGTGRWQLTNITLRHVAVPGAVPAGGMTRHLLSSGGGGRVDLRGVKFELRKQAGAFTGSDGYHVRVVSADGGDIWFYPSAVAFGFETVASENDHMSCDVLAAQRDGNIYLNRTTTAYEFDIPCTGSCTHFASLFDGGAIKPFSTGSRLTFSGSGVTGQRYYVMTGSYINGAGSATYFPGDSEGYVESATYCWYK